MRYLFLLSLIVAIGCSGKPATPIATIPPPPATALTPAKSAADLLGGPEVVAIIREADKAEGYRLQDEYLKEKPSDYRASAGPLALSKEAQQGWATAVTAYDTYEREIAPGCEPIFGVRTTFTRGEDTVDVVYCYGCNLLTVYRNGKHVGDGYFAPGRKELARLAKQLLPDDAAIQKLD